jgi:hypothetical protein
MTVKAVRFVAFPFGAGLAYAPHEGNTVSPAPRSYRDAVHAQLANPTGRLYTVEDTSDPTIEDHSQINVLARADCYPLDLLETKVPGVGCNAEGAWTLRDLGPRTEGHRWVTHFRNDQLGGYHNGDYFDTFDDAVRGFAERSAKALTYLADRATFDRVAA